MAGGETVEWPNSVEELTPSMQCSPGDFSGYLLSRQAGWNVTTVVSSGTRGAELEPCPGSRVRSCEVAQEGVQSRTDGRERCDDYSNPSRDRKDL